MKLIASDYDNTLNCFKLDLLINLIYLKKFIKNNNIFLLNTGRNLESIKKEIKKYKIPFNYLACCDGNVLLDNNYKVLYVSNLSIDIYDDLKKLQKDFDFDIKIVKYLNNILEYEVIILKLNERFLKHLKKIMIKYKLCFKTFKKFKYHLYIYDENISKSTPITFLKSKYGISLDNIYSIGDNINDIEMLKDYNGYLVFWAKRDMYQYVKNTCYLVPLLIKKINNK